MNAITVRNLTKRYREQLAVDSISFDVREGEFFALLGENGAGKSTTINMLCTILEKTAGEVSVFENRLGSDDAAIRDSIGIVFQNSVLDDILTVRENLLTRASYYGLSRDEALGRLEPFMESFELNDIWNRRYRNLSGGQRRRVDIVRALINQPRILFLDEPTTGLDPKSRRIVWEHIDRLRRDEKLTLFLTTHYMEETRDADSVVIMDKGKIIAQGSPTELKNRWSRSRLVWYAPRNEANDALLSGFDYDYDAERYNVFFDGAITDFVYANRDRITDYEILKGTMDDVFLNLTGKELAE